MMHRRSFDDFIAGQQQTAKGFFHEKRNVGINYPKCRTAFPTDLSGLFTLGPDVSLNSLQTQRPDLGLIISPTLTNYFGISLNKDNLIEDRLVQFSESRLDFVLWSFPGNNSARRLEGTQPPGLRILRKQGRMPLADKTRTTVASQAHHLFRGVLPNDVLCYLVQPGHRFETYPIQVILEDSGPDDVLPARQVGQDLLQRGRLSDAASADDTNPTLG